MLSVMEDAANTVMVAGCAMVVLQGNSNRKAAKKAARRLVDKALFRA
jgi:hypothetical protein